MLEAMWTILYASDDVRSFAARSLVVARALPRGRARWARTVDAPDPVLWGSATLPETTPRKPAPSREGGLWRLAGGRRAARPDWRRGAPRLGWPRSCTPKWGRRKACSGSNLRIYTLFIVNMARWRRWDKGASGASQMMQRAQVVQGWGHACELGGTTIFIYLGCFMHRAQCEIDTLLYPFAHIALAAHSGYPIYPQWVDLTKITCFVGTR